MPTENICELQVLHVLTEIVVVGLLILVTPVGFIVISHWGFNFHFLVTDAFEQFLCPIGHPHIFFYVRYVQLFGVIFKSGY